MGGTKWVGGGVVGIFLELTFLGVGGEGEGVDLAVVGDSDLVGMGVVNLGGGVGDAFGDATDLVGVGADLGDGADLRAEYAKAGVAGLKAVADLVRGEGDEKVREESWSRSKSAPPSPSCANMTRMLTSERWGTDEGGGEGVGEGWEDCSGERLEDGVAVVGEKRYSPSTSTERRSSEREE
jgi:hypothetical protein